MAEVKGVSIAADTIKGLRQVINGLRDDLFKLKEGSDAYKAKVVELQSAQEKLNSVMSLTNKTVMAQAKEIKAAEGSYDDIIAKNKILRDEWRKMEIGTEAWKAQAAEIKRNEDLLISADEAIGRHQRKVGNYVGAISPLTFQINQLVREMPSLTMSANQFFLAISNNLPMFADEVSKLREANKELVAQGKPTVNIFKEIVKGVFSWQTALVVLITVLTQFGGKIVEWVKSLGTAKISLDNLLKSINAFATAVDTDRRELDALYGALTNAQKGTTQYAMARKAIEEKYGKYLENQSAEIRNLDDMSAAYDVLRGKIEAISIAKTIESERSAILKQYQDTLNDAFDGLSRAFERKFGTELGAKYLTSLRIGLNSGIPELEAEAKRIVGLFENQDVGKGFYKVHTAVREANDAFKLYTEQMRGVQSIANQMGNLLGVEPSDVEEIEVANSTIIDTTDTLRKFITTEDIARDITRQTTTAWRELKNELKAVNGELGEFADNYLAALDAQREYLDSKISEYQEEAQERIRWAELGADGSAKAEQRVAQEKYQYQQYALNQELLLLQEGLENAIYYGDERVKAEQRVAQIQRDIAYNTAQYEQQQARKTKEEKVKSTKGWIDVAVAGAQAMSGILGNVADMYEEEGEANEESLKKAKNLRIAGATMDMLGGITAAIAGAFTTKTGPWDFVLAGIQAATILASGLANIAQIRKTDTSGNSSVGSSGNVSALVNAPAVVQQVPITRTLTGVAEQDELNKSQRVYVVYDDIKQAGRKVETTESEATF